jgi:hypothetical protein
MPQCAYCRQPSGGFDETGEFEPGYHMCTAMKQVPKTHADRERGEDTMCGRSSGGLAIDNKFPSCKACQKAETAHQRKLDESRDRLWAAYGRQDYKDRNGT